MKKKVSTSNDEPGALRSHALRNWEMAVLHCRDLRHSWDWPGVTYSLLGQGLIRRSITCGTCGTARTDEIVRTSGIYHRSPRYAYLDGYRVFGVGRVLSAEVRREELRRIIKPKGAAR